MLISTLKEAITSNFLTFWNLASDKSNDIAVRNNAKMFLQAARVLFDDKDKQTVIN